MKTAVRSVWLVIVVSSRYLVLRVGPADLRDRRIVARIGRGVGRQCRARRRDDAIEEVAAEARQVAEAASDAEPVLHRAGDHVRGDILVVARPQAVEVAEVEIVHGRARRPGELGQRAGQPVVGNVVLLQTLIAERSPWSGVRDRCRSTEQSPIPFA